MSEQPRRRQTMGDIYARVWPDATAEELRRPYDLLGDADEEVYTFAEMLRLLGLEGEEK